MTARNSEPSLRNAISIAGDALFDLIDNNTATVLVLVRLFFAMVIAAAIESIWPGHGIVLGAGGFIGATISAARRLDHPHSSER